MKGVAFLKELVSIPSLSGQEDAVATYLVQKMEDLGLDAQRDGVGNVVGTLGDPTAERTIVLLGHMDTVPGSIPVRQEGDRLYGRGTVDAKGPLAAFVLAAVRMVSRLDGARLVVVGAVEEEARSRGAHFLARTMPSPLCAIIGEPSGWQGITLGYKGTLSVEYRLAQPVKHTAGERVAPAEKAVAFWNGLVSYAAAFNEGRGRTFDNLSPTLQSIHTFGDGFEEGVEMNIGLRLPPGLELAVLKRQMRAWRGAAQLEFPYSEPVYQSDKNNPPVRALLRAIRAEGGRPRFKLKTGTSDMNVVGPTWGCPTVAYGPGNSALDHTPNEHIELEEFRRGVDVLERALETLVA
jgi:LysW-gamma-L-lysine carboxypeptidase